MALARAEDQNGNTIGAENYYQHAEHYLRSLSSDAEEVNLMSFKFLVGQAVKYTPIGEKKPGLFTIVRQMPKEDRAIDVYYRIKSEAEDHERNVAESQLSPDIGTDSSFAAIGSGDNDGAEADREIPS